MFWFSLLFLALVPNAFGKPRPQGDGNVNVTATDGGGATFDCICKATPNEQDSYVCKCGPETAIECLCKESKDEPGNYICKCPNAGGGGTPNPSLPVEGGNQEETPAPGRGPGEGLVCTCQVNPKNASGPHVCKCSPSAEGAANPNVPVVNPGSSVMPPVSVTGEASPSGSEATTPAGGASETPGGGSEIPGGGAVTPSGSMTTHHGALNTTKTFVVCVKNGPNDVPTSTYLTSGKGKSVKVQGQWEVYKCKWGLVEPFVINETLYNDLVAQCKAKGYEFPQPNDDKHSSSYPFQYEGVITEYYRHRTPFAFNKIPQFPADRCIDERKRRRNQKRRNH